MMAPKFATIVLVILLSARTAAAADAAVLLRPNATQIDRPAASWRSAPSAYGRYFGRGSGPPPFAAYYAPQIATLRDGTVECVTQLAQQHNGWWRRMGYCRARD